MTTMNDQYRFVKSEVIHELPGGIKCKTSWQLLCPRGGFSGWLICTEDKKTYSIFNDDKYIAAFGNFDDAKNRLIEEYRKLKH